MRATMGAFVKGSSLMVDGGFIAGHTLKLAWAAVAALPSRAQTFSTLTWTTASPQPPWSTPTSTQ